LKFVGILRMFALPGGKFGWQSTHIDGISASLKD
jgi:hypothetical protein